MKPIQPGCFAATLVLGIAPLAAENLPLHPELAVAASKVDTAGSFFEVDLVQEDTFHHQNRKSDPKAP